MSEPIVWIDDRERAVAFALAKSETISGGFAEWPKILASYREEILESETGRIALERDLARAERNVMSDEVERLRPIAHALEVIESDQLYLEYHEDESTRGLKGGVEVVGEIMSGFGLTLVEAVDKYEKKREREDEARREDACASR